MELNNKVLEEMKESLNSQHINVVIDREIDYNDYCYENTIFSEMIEEITEPTKKVKENLDTIISEKKKSDKSSSTISCWSLFIAIITLLATIAGIFIQFL